MELITQFLSTPFDFLMEYGLPFILVLGVLVFVHEWGHYIVARMCGVRVETFSIGFGPKLFGRKDKNGTDWKVSLIPLGGYVQMFGDSDPASSSHSEEVTEDGEKPRKMTKKERSVAFFSQALWKRSAIILAGPAINFIFAIVLLTGLYAAYGQPYTPPIAATLVEGAPAELAGVEPDDKIISINGQEMRRFSDMVEIVSVSLNEDLNVTLVRSLGEEKGWDEENPITLNIRPELFEIEDRFGFKHSMGRIGIRSPSGEFATQDHSIFSAFGSALTKTWLLTTNTLKAIGQMVTGERSADELGGILRIGAYAGEFAQHGLVSLITFAALISVNLGLINLFPIPLLDGGHLAFYAVEAVKGSPMNEKFQEYAMRTGLVLVVSLMLFATWNDLVQLKVVDYVVNLVS